MTIPHVLFIGGHDPSGGAGLQADLETAMAHGCRATSLVTCLTAQDTHDVRAVFPQDPSAFVQQLELLLADMPPDLVKIGLLGDAALARGLAAPLSRLGVPVVLDPVLAAGGGHSMADQTLVEVMREALLPLCALVTPNRREARALGQSGDPVAAAQRLLDRGAAWVLLTGADESEARDVRNLLLGEGRRQSFDYPLLPHSYHGSGCTLAAACACRMARGESIAEAVRGAQDWTWRCLVEGRPASDGQWLPNRHIEVMP
ncbi:MAG: hydroxymethylpyrimidine/phosphomethylpyrimidine kinase [Gammaproteobacteria bacterium]|nr:MAG: hydroxymethylpyrimidine/phosphomethylpyrimidine kinase [Gammaproteobacteria bacterium]